jgi:YesN/AraC family two-component response regulator
MQALTLRVLVVDDSQVVRRGICQILQSQADIEVICEAADGADAVRKALEHKPDIVLLDITMPVMNGFEAARRMKHDPHGEPVRFCSICKGSSCGWCERIRGEE